MRQNSALTLPKLCVIVLDHVIQDYHLGQHLTEALCRNQKLAKSRENLPPNKLAETINDSVKVVFAIPSVTIFPGLY